MFLYLVLAVIALIVYLLRSNKLDYWEKKGVPTASGSEWFFGHYRPVMFLTKHIHEFYGAMYKEFPDAPLVGYYAMSAPGLIVRDLDLLKFIMVSEFSSFNFSGRSVDKKVDALAGSHPFFLAGEEWRTARAHITPALTQTKLRGYLPIMLKVGDEMIKYMKNNATAELETLELVQKYATDVIANAMFGVANNTFENADSPIARLTRQIKFDQSVMDNLKGFILQRPILRSLFPARFTPRKLEELMVPLVSQLIEERTDRETGEQPSDAFQVLVNLKQNDTKGVITNETISGYVFTIITDLYQTSSSITSLILYRLSRHPEIQMKLTEEFREIKSRNGGEYTIEDIENAKYLDMVFCESCRIFSFMTSRMCTQDCYLPVPNAEPVKITKGTPIVIPSISIHMDEKYYPDPETFNPERFTEEEIAKRPKFTYLPWGEGPKKCMGIRISTTQIKVALMKIIENFNLTPSPKTKYPLKFDPTAGFICRPKEGTWVVFDPVN